MTVEIDQIEDAIIAAIRNDATMGAYIKTVESYEGQLEADLTRLPRLFPAIFVSFAGAEFPAFIDQCIEATYRFSLFLAARSYRGNVAARRGVVGQIGIRTMLKDLRKLLVGSTLGLPEIPPLLPGPVEPIVNTRILSIYGAQYIVDRLGIPRGA